MVRRQLLFDECEDLMDVDDEVKIDDKGRLQTILLHGGPILNISFAAAMKFTGCYKDLKGCAFDDTIRELMAMISVLVEMGVCKIRY